MRTFHVVHRDSKELQSVIFNFTFWLLYFVRSKKMNFLPSGTFVENWSYSVTTSTGSPKNFQPIRDSSFLKQRIERANLIANCPIF